jgi:type I restriction enzyme S subunit
MHSEHPVLKVRELMQRDILDVNDGYRAKNSELSAQGLPFARAGNILGGFNFADADRFPEADLRKVGKKVSRPGDVVFTSKGTVGRFAFVSCDTPRFVYSPQLCFWRSLDPEVLVPRFLYYWMHGPDFSDQADAVKGQTDMADYVSLRDQREFLVPIPPIDEQRAIARILGIVDDKIASNRNLNESIGATCQALFRSWFVDFDPVVAKNEGRQPPHLSAEVAAMFPSGLQETDNGSLPEGWSTEPLDAIADFQNGLALQKFRPKPGDPRLPVIKIAQLRSGAPDGDEWASASIKPECVLEDGDLVFSWSGSLMVVLWCGGPGALNQHLFKVTSTHYPKWFCQQWVLFHLPEFQAIAADKATTMGHIQRHHLTEAVCNIPSAPVLQAADAILGPMVEHYVHNELESRTLTALRDALLPRLLSGELRVRQAEKLVEEAI